MGRTIQWFFSALADSYRTLAIDLPGFGDSVKPVGAAYDPRFFAKAVCGFLDACGIDSAHLIGNSMGGRVALEVGFRHPDRVDRIVGLAASPAWRRDRRWAPLVKALRPELGLLQIAPRPVVEEFARRFVPGGRDGWSAVGVDEFLRAYLRRAGAPPSTRRCATSTSTSPRGRRASGRACASSRATRCSCGAATTGSCRSPSPATCARRCRAPSTSSSTAGTCRSSRRRARRMRRCGGSSGEPAPRPSAGGERGERQRRRVRE